MPTVTSSNAAAAAAVAALQSVLNSPAAAILVIFSAAGTAAEFTNFCIGGSISVNNGYEKPTFANVFPLSANICLHIYVHRLVPICLRFSATVEMSAHAWN